MAIILFYFQGGEIYTIYFHAMQAHQFNSESRTRVQRKARNATRTINGQIVSDRQSVCINNQINVCSNSELKINQNYWIIRIFPQLKNFEIKTHRDRRVSEERRRKNEFWMKNKKPFEYSSKSYIFVMNFSIEIHPIEFPSDRFEIDFTP